MSCEDNTLSYELIYLDSAKYSLDKAYGVICKRERLEFVKEAISSLEEAKTELEYDLGWKEKTK